MLQENLLSKMPSADLQKVNEALKTISNTLEPYLGRLSRADCMDFFKMENSCEPLIQEFLYYTLTDRLIFKKSNRSPSKKESPISPSELRILNYLKSGMTSKEIASRLNLSLHTVKTHRKNMFEKAGVQNVVELLNFAGEHNLF